jgi:hypothetical protein
VSDNPITVDASALTTAAVNGLTLAGAGAITATVGPSALKIDGSTSTGKLVLTGNAATATITGGSGADIITSGGASDTLTGGAGVDTITAGTGADKIIVITAPAGDIDTTAGSVTDIVNGFKTADADTLSGFGAVGEAHIDAVTAVKQVSTITIAHDGAADKITVAGIGGSTAAVPYHTDHDTTIADLVTAINGISGVTVVATATGNATAKIVTLTANTAGTAFTATTTIADGLEDGTALTAIVATTTANTVGVTGVAGNYVENETSVSDLATLLAAADTQLTSTIHYYFGVTGGNGYLVVDNDGNGYTDVIQLSGVTTLAATDIVA